MTFNMNKPGVDRRASTQNQVDQIIEFLEKMAMDLNYHLNHLDQNNLTEEMQKKILNANLIERIEKTIGKELEEV